MATFHVVATTVARDALTGLAVDDFVFNKETGETTRWNGTGHVPAIARRVELEDAVVRGAAAALNSAGPPAASSVGAMNATLLAAIDWIDEGKVASASNNDDGHVSLTKSSSVVTWNPSGSLGAGKWVEVLRSGTATGTQSSTSLQDSGFSAPDNDVHATAMIRLSGGTGRGQCRLCKGIGIGTGVWNLHASYPWDTTPVAGSTQYEILATRDQTAGAFSDTGKAFEVAIIDGTGRGQWRTIVAHNTTKLYVDRLWDVVPDSTSVFRILPSALTTTRFSSKPAVLPNGVTRIDLADGWLDAWRSLYGAKLIGGGRGVTTIRAHGGYTARQCGANVSMTATTFTDSGAAWAVGRWKNRYLYLWDDHGTPVASVRIVNNTGTVLTLDQAAWPQAASGTVTQAVSASAFNDTNLVNFALDGYRFMACRMIDGPAAGQIRQVSASHSGTTLEFVTAFSAAPQASNAYVLERRPGANWYYAIAEPIALELNGVANAEIGGFSIEGDSSAEIIDLIRASWRRSYEGGNRQNDYGEDPWRSARSNSENRYYDLEARGRWIDSAFRNGNANKGGNYQVDISHGVNVKAVGTAFSINDVSQPWLHNQNGIYIGSGRYGNNVIHRLTFPYVIACQRGIVLDISDLVVDGGVVQGCFIDVQINGMENFCEIHNIRSEESHQFVYAGFLAAKSCRALISGCDMNLDGAARMPDWGNLIQWGLAGTLHVERLRTAHIDPSPVTFTSLANTDPTKIEIDVATLSRAIASGYLNGKGFLAILIGGSQTGQYRVISSNDTDTLTLASGFGSAVGAGQSVMICEAAMAPIPFTAAAGGSTITIRTSTTHMPRTLGGCRVLTQTGPSAGSNGLVNTNTRDRFYLDWPLSVPMNAGDIGVVLPARFSNVGVGGGVIATISNTELPGSPVQKAFRQQRGGGLFDVLFQNYKELDRDNQERARWPGFVLYGTSAQPIIQAGALDGAVVSPAGAAPDTGLVRTANGLWQFKNSVAVQGFQVASVRKTANYTASIFDNVILMDASGGSRTVTLPPLSAAYDATNSRGLVLTVVKDESSANAVTVDGNGAETIDGAATYVIPGGARGRVTVTAFSDGWRVT